MGVEPQTLAWGAFLEPSSRAECSRCHGASRTAPSRQMQNSWQPRNLSVGEGGGRAPPPGKQWCVFCNGPELEITQRTAEFLGKSC